MIVGQRKINLTPWAFLALPLTFYLIWVIAPVVQTIGYSLTDYDGVTFDAAFIGLENFRLLFTDRIFWTALANNVRWLIFFALLPIPIGLGLAMLLNQGYQGSHFFRTVLFLPMTLSFVIIGQIWGWIYLPRAGALNTLLEFIGMSGFTRPWLSDPGTVTYSLIAAGTWRQIPYVMILYLAGLQSVPTDLVEAAMIDGASWWQRFVRVVIPMLLPSTVVAVSISIIDSLRAFDIVFVMTRGGPFNQSQVLANFMYIEAFNNYRMGYGAAIAVIQFAVTFTFIYLYVNYTMKREQAR